MHSVPVVSSPRFSGPSIGMKTLAKNVAPEINKNKIPNGNQSPPNVFANETPINGVVPPKIAPHSWKLREMPV